LLGLAIGGCLCNHLHYVAEEMNFRLVSVAVDVIMTFEGNPLLATHASVEVAVQAQDDMADLDTLIERAKASSTVSNSLARSVPVSFSTLPFDAKSPAPRHTHA
jgi:organic hydroperoxide reductase OsmC/OhrA